MSLARTRLLFLRSPLSKARNFSTSRQHGTRYLGKISTGLLFTIGLGCSPWYFPIHADTQRLASPSGSYPDPSSVDGVDRSFAASLRAYIVYAMCSIPALVDNSPKILSLLTSVPGLKQITEAFVRITFFDQFVGGDTANDTIALVEKLRASNTGTLFAYSVEVDEDEASGRSGRKPKQPVHKLIVDEMIKCIDVAADFEDRHATSGKDRSRRTWIAVKMTALLPDAQALINLSSHILNTRPRLSPPIVFPGCPHPTDLDSLYNRDPNSPVSKEEVTSLKGLYADLYRICSRAQERGVKIIIDAEYSWYQPAVDVLALSLMRHFNQLPDPTQPSALQGNEVQPLVYATFQAYLRRTPEHLVRSIADAKANNYALGVKLVRGAYHPHEIAAHSGPKGTTLSISPDPFPPVWTTKADTDDCYNKCARMLIGAIKDDVSPPDAPDLSLEMAKRPPTIGVLFGTHNWTSCNLILDELVLAGLAVEETGEDRAVRVGEDVTDRLTLGQLYGMSDGLTSYIVGRIRSSSPFVVKYIPYGALSDVMPYLGRRAIENKSVLGDGGAVAERKRAGAELRKKLTSLLSW